MPIFEKEEKNSIIISILFYLKKKKYTTNNAKNCYLKVCIICVYIFFHPKLLVKFIGNIGKELMYKYMRVLKI